jgi:hypothetical protein
MEKGGGVSVERAPERQARRKNNTHNHPTLTILALGLAPSDQGADGQQLVDLMMRA